MKRLFHGMALAGVVVFAAPVWAESPMSPLRRAPPLSSAPQPSQPSAGADNGVPPAQNAGDAAIGARPEPRAARRGAAGRIKSGLWEFTSELQAAAVSLAAAGKPAQETPTQAAGGAKTSYTSCIAPDDAVPAELGRQCKLDRSERKGARITWWMSCESTQLQAEGVAQYAGDTMQATMISHLRGAGAAVTDVTQDITGRYLGPCQQHALMPSQPPALAGPSGAPASPVNAASANEASAPPATANNAAANTAGANTATAKTAPPADVHAAPPATEAAAAGPRTRREARRHARHARSAHRGHRSYRARRATPRYWAGRSAYYGAFGPNPYSSGGP